MKKFNYLIAGLAAISLAACSNDEPGGNGTNPVKPEGDVAYMNILIQAANQSRSTTSDGFQPSWDKADEHNVKSLRFYFFDENGVKAEIEAEDPDAEFDQNGTNPGKPNVEYIGKKNVIILKGLSGKDYPSYVLTVLNLPDWTCPATLAEATKSLADFTENGPFVMTTSSYFAAGDVNHNDKYYYATKLDSSNFYTTEEAAVADKNAVEIYVERLGAKVQVDVTAENEKFENVTRVDKDGNVVETGITIYKLDQTVGGGGNEGEGSNPDALTTQLYLQVTGWNLNATAPTSYLGKQLDAKWNTTDVFAGWNDNANHRSYWAESTIYGSTVDAATLINSKLNYIKTNQLNKKVGLTNTDDYIVYCYENTNDVDNLFDLNANEDLAGKDKVLVNNATHVVLETRVGTYDAEKKQFKAEDYITYRGVLYKEASYMNLILNRLKAAGQLNLYLKTKETGDIESGLTKEYEQIGTEYFEAYQEEGAGLGVVMIRLKDGSVSDSELFMLNAESKYVPVAEGAVEQLKKDVADAQSTNDNYPAVRHTDGTSIYNIPVEHLAAKAGETEAVEGYYGVVRNHWYQIEITKFSRVGHGVFDPENGSETIITPPVEDPLYYVGAHINILSWKLVNQQTEL